MAALTPQLGFSYKVIDYLDQWLSALASLWNAHANTIKLGVFQGGALVFLKSFLGHSKAQPILRTTDFDALENAYTD